MGLDIHSVEVGGEGDCFYHSVGAGLETLLLHSEEAKRHVLQKLPRGIFTGDSKQVVKDLRCLAAKQLRHWTAEDLLNYFVNATSDQRLGQWRDGWNPTELLHASQLSCIIGCETVQAVGTHLHGDPGDIIISMRRANANPGGGEPEELLTLVPQGETHIATLRSHLQDVFRTVGNMHCGDATDAALLVQALDVGIFIFADKLQRNNESCLCALALRNGKYPFYISIWWNEPSHFRSFRMRTDQSKRFPSVWTAAEIPVFLREQYDLMNPDAPLS